VGILVEFTGLGLAHDQLVVPERHVVARIEMSVDSLLRVLLYIMAAYDAGASASQHAFHEQVMLSNLSYQERKRES